MTDRPTLKDEEIEITPEMIEAGEKVLCLGCAPETPISQLPTHVLAEVYISMARRARE